jgi:hypothetical protein
MGRVVEAFDTHLERVVAFKEVLASGGANDARRFAREVRITARLEHASIVPLYDAGTSADGRPYYVMRRVSGSPLDQLLARAKELPLRLALLPNLLAACDAVAHAHRRGVIHRDLKPQNILVGELGETVVIDWGLAKVIGEEETPSIEPRVPAASDSLHTQAGSVFGTPGFMPPEQARGDELGPQSDVFALGATLYHLLAGRPPVTGRSATEVLEATYKHALLPIAKACPAAPPELVAIVDKALAAEPGDRYVDAAALAEDVRRFLTGQVVAAHRYTRRERLARFVKRHRAPLAVGVLALAAVVVVATFSVRRIVAERDAANDAEATAVAERRAAETARGDAEHQRDAQLLAHAEALLDTDPTKAAALLAGVPPHSAVLDDARALAQAAMVRGVATSIATVAGTPLGGVLSPDTRLFAQTTIEGSFAVYDLDARRRVLEQPCSRGTRPLWLAGGKQLLLYDGKAPSSIVDPATGDPLGDPLPALDVPVVTARGDRIIYVDPARHAWLFDVATRAATRVPGEDVGDVRIGDDGSWYAVADALGVTAYAASGMVLSHRDGKVQLAVAGTRRLAIIAKPSGQVFELVLDPAPTWIERPIALTAGDHVLWIVYRADRLFFASAMRPLAPWNEPTSAIPAENRAYFGVWAGDAIVAIANDGGLYFDAPGGAGNIHMPIAARNARLAGLPGKSRIVVAMDGRALIYELDDAVARVLTIPDPGDATFVDDELLFLSSIEPDGAWYDLATGKYSRPARHYRAFTMLWDVDRAGRRALRLVEDAPDHAMLVVSAPGEGDRVVDTVGPELTGRTPAKVSPMDHPPPARFVSGGAIAIGSGSHLRVALGDGPAHDVADLGSRIVALAPCGHLQVVVITERGEVVRVHFDSGTTERAHVALGDTLALAADDDGHVWIGIDKRVLRWDGDVHEVATVARPVVGLVATSAGAVAVEQGNAVAWVVPGRAAAELLGASDAEPALSADGHLVAGVGPSGRLEVIELPAGKSWTLPWGQTVSGGRLALAPSKRLAVQSFSDRDGGLVFVTKLPEAAPDLRGWLAGLTNAEIGSDGALQWR